jgi:4-diphosphocytidyl-2-C-methyl-D-erythritol kinase
MRESAPLSSVDLFAPAKVNLSLQVVGRRADGYHLLDSLVVFAGVGDDLHFEAADSLSLTVDGPAAGALADQPDNIVLKAAHRLADAAGIRPSAAIRLTKRLPVAAGIGGGSADGAATLKGLCALWGIDPGDDELARIGLGLGADLPVCLAGRPTRVTGIGECLSPALTLPAAWMLLVNPRIALPTPAVFKARRGDFSVPTPLEEAPADAAALAEALRSRPNDLTSPAVHLAPVIATVLDAIEGQRGCLLARMSGSGATCFGLFADNASASAAAAAMSKGYPDWWIAAAPLLGGQGKSRP